MAGLMCTWCGNEIPIPTKHQRDIFSRCGRVYCKPECGKEYSKRISSETASATNKRFASDRMKRHNPMSDVKTKEKMRSTLIEHGVKPMTRGGNGTGLTVSQSLLLASLGCFSPIPEFAISTGRRGNGYPSNYKVDIAIPSLKVAIEVDGKSHTLIERKAQDQKKEALLRSLGWTVLRVSNGEVINHYAECVSRLVSVLEGIAHVRAS